MICVGMRKQKDYWMKAWRAIEQFRGTFRRKQIVRCGSLLKVSDRPAFELPVLRLLY